MVVLPFPPPGQRHLPVLDGFRGLSILAVLAAHMLPLGPSGLDLNFMSGLMGMSVFFCLSGFLITRFLWERPEILPFLVRRAARIVPLILVFTAVYCGLLFSRWDTFVAANLYVFNYADLGFPGVTPLWSVSLEMHFYLAVAVAVGAFGRKGFWLVPLAAIVVTGMRIEGGVDASVRTHLRADEILSGSLLALGWLNRDRRSVRAALDALPGLFWLVLALWLLSCHRAFQELTYLRPYFCAAMIGSVLMMPTNILTRVLSSAPLRYIAAVSFAVYVLHSPFRVGWFDAGSDAERYLFKRPLGLLCTVVLAHLSTFHFEKPITAWAHRITAGPRGRSRASVLMPGSAASS